MIRVFLCIMDDGLLKDLIDFSHVNGMEIVGFSAVIPIDLDFLLDMRIDAVVIRDAIDVKRANTMEEKIRNIPIYRHIRLIHIFKEIDGSTFHTLIQSCVNNYLLESYSARDVLAKVRDEVESTDKNRNVARFIEETGTDILTENGIPANLKGFTYMKSAAFVIVQHSSRFALNEVYRSVASAYETTSDCVEKAIRSALQQGYQKHPDCMLYNGKKPTNGAALRMMIELLKIRGMMVQEEI